MTFPAALVTASLMVMGLALMGLVWGWLVRPEKQWILPGFLTPVILLVTFTYLLYN